MTRAPLPSRPDSRLTGWVAGTLALWTVLTTIAATIVASVDLPYSDEWDSWMGWMKQGCSLQWLFALNNDHRIVTTRLLFAIDRLAFEGRVWVPQAVSLAAQASLAVLLWRLAKRCGVTDSRDSGVLGAAIACCLFSASQYFNFVWGFQVQFFLVYAAGAAALWALLRAAEAAHPGGRRAWMTACLLLAAACSYSMANGVFIWPILLLAAVRLKIGRAGVALLGAAGVLVVWQYAHGWHTSVLDAPAPLWRVALFAVANAGSPALPMLYGLGAGTAAAGMAASLAGTVVLASAALQGFALWNRRTQFPGGRIVLAHFTVFVAAASLAIASGRAHLPMVAAFRSRYMTPPWILWACLLCLAWGRLRALGPRVLRWAVLTALLFGVAVHQMQAFRSAREYGAALTRASAALAVGVNDPEMFGILSRPFTDTAPAAEYLRRNRLAIFREDWTHWPGQPLAARFTVDPGVSSCHGGIRDAVPISDPVRPGWRVSGWARDASGYGPSRIVLADSSGKILGVASEDSGRWIGYALPGSPSITAYAVGTDGKSLCSLGTRPLAR